MSTTIVPFARSSTSSRPPPQHLAHEADSNPREASPRRRPRPYRSPTRSANCRLGTRAWIVATASPSDADCAMTAATLRFLADARAIRGRAVVNVDPDARELEEAEAEEKDAARALEYARATIRRGARRDANRGGRGRILRGEPRRPKTHVRGRKGSRGRRGEARIRRESRASRVGVGEKLRGEKLRLRGRVTFPSGDARRARATRGGRAASPRRPRALDREAQALRARTRRRRQGERAPERNFREIDDDAASFARRRIREPGRRAGRFARVSTRAIRSDRGRRRDAFNRVRHRRRRDDVRVGPFVDVVLDGLGVRSRHCGRLEPRRTRRIRAGCARRSSRRSTRARTCGSTASGSGW